MEKYLAFLPVGTQVVIRDAVAIEGRGEPLPKGSVGVVAEMPADHQHKYRIRFVDGGEVFLLRRSLSIRKLQHDDNLADVGKIMAECDLRQHVIYRCLVGSCAYGLAHEGSDEDRRGVYLPPAELHWSLWGAPEQMEDAEADECYWELRKFLVLALKGNPNILECLYTPLVEHANELGRELRAMRSRFLSRILYQTYNGYAMGQFKKLEQDLRARGEIKMKHAMHLVRLLLSGIHALRTGEIAVDVGEHREQLLAIRWSRIPWEEVNAWRLALHREFEAAWQDTRLPERPDYAAANTFLLKARRAMVDP